ncbi:MAG: DNA-3-methyladenine glycosylase [Acidimicrobiales bacterium]
MKALPLSFYQRDPRVVAPDLLGKVLVGEGLAARIVEVEAYCGAEDPGSHAYRGMTKRNATMFGPAGRLYVYFTYGMHWCANAVCGDDGDGVAVLLRAAEPLDGLELMRPRRLAARTDRDLCRGPARLCQAFAITGDHDGADLVSGDRGVSLVDDGTPPPEAPAASVRIGLSAGQDLPWRWSVPGSRHLSRPA